MNRQRWAVNGAGGYQLASGFRAAVDLRKRDAQALDLAEQGALVHAQFPRRCQAVVAVAASGYTEDPIMNKPAEFGFTASIRKPYTGRELANVLNSCFDQKWQNI